MNKVYIYCIYNNKYIKDFYIGSTKDYKKRMDTHKSSCNNPNSPQHDFKVYKFIRDNGGWSVWSKMIIATVDVEDKIQQKRIEQVYIDHLEPSLNDRRSHSTPEQLKEYQKEYQIQNKEKHNVYQKKYYHKNKEKINENQNKKFNCICGGKYTNKHKATHQRTNIHQNYILKTNQTNLINKYIN